MYTSKGTIKAEFLLNNGTVSTTLSFVPDCDYSIRHRGKTFAVFVDRQGGALIKEYDKDNDIKIQVNRELVRSVGSYGCTNAEVEIEVRQPTGTDPAVPKEIADAGSVVVQQIKATASSGKEDEFVQAFLDLCLKVRAMERATGDGSSGLELIRLKIPAK